MNNISGLSDIPQKIARKIVRLLRASNTVLPETIVLNRFFLSEVDVNNISFTVKRPDARLEAAIEELGCFICDRDEDRLSVVSYQQ